MIDIRAIAKKRAHSVAVKRRLERERHRIRKEMERLRVTLLMVARELEKPTEN